MLSVIANIEFGWPDIIQQILRYQQMIATLPTQIISFDCLMIDYVTGENPEFRFNYMRLFTFSVLPIAVIIFSFIFWCFKACCCNRLSAKRRTDKTVATISIIWYVFYPTIVSYLASSINCTVIEGTNRLYADLEEICFEGNHLLAVYCITIPGLVLWAFGMPILGLILVRRGLRHLEENKFHSNPQIYKGLLQRFRLRLGFLTQGYNEDFYYWEIVLLLRKTILVLMLTFLAPVSAGIQSLSAILLLIFALVLQFLKQPFYDPKLNNLEATSLVV